MESEDETIRSLLIRLHEGDRDALGVLLERHLPWLQDYVRSHLGEELRQIGDTVDHTNDVIVRVLMTKAKFLVNDEDHFRRLLARMVRNSLVDSHRHWTADRRDLKRSKPMEQTVVDLGRGSTATSIFRKKEERALLELALDLIDPDFRSLIEMRDRLEMSFVDIAKRTDWAMPRVRTLYHRAKIALGRTVRALERGEFDEF